MPGAIEIPHPTITVRKLNHQGRELFRYSAELLEVTDSYVKLQAIYDLPDNDLHGFRFRTGDRFLEWHYLDRWYNIFAVHDVDSQQLKGWYCNITRPATFKDQVLSADDLALDLVVQVDGSWQVLDQDEFERLELDPGDERQVLAALEQLKRSAEGRHEPFFTS